MGKNSSSSGSRFLGAELRRLRGSRTLAEITQLARAHPMSEGAPRLSPSSLWEIETGQTMPSLASACHLAIVYQVSPLRLFNALLNERVEDDAQALAGAADLEAAVRDALDGGRIKEALAGALRGEQGASSAAERWQWIMYRALAMNRMGMRQDAMALLLECTEAPDFPRARAWEVHRYLSGIAAGAGFIQLAADQMKRALDTAPQQAQPLTRAYLLLSHVRLIVMAHEYGLSNDPRALREAVRQIEEARTHASGASEALRLSLELFDAALQELLGNRLLAATRYKSLAEAASKVGCGEVEVHAWLSLGTLQRRQGKRLEARQALRQAEKLALAAGYKQACFDIYFELLQVTPATEPAHRETYLEKAREFASSVEGRTPNIVAFERMLAAGGSQ